MDYAKDINELTEGTVSYTVPTIEERKEILIEYVRRYALKKWYQKKKYLLYTAVSQARIINSYNHKRKENK